MEVVSEDTRLRSLFGSDAGVPRAVEYIQKGIDSKRREGKLHFPLPYPVPEYPPTQFVLDQTGSGAPSWMTKVLETPDNRRLYYEMDALMNTGAWLERAVVAHDLVVKMARSTMFGPEDVAEMIEVEGEYLQAALKAMHRRKTYFEMTGRYGYRVANGMDRYLRGLRATRRRRRQ